MPTRIKDYGLMVERKLDWISRHDPKSKDYRIRSIIGNRVEVRPQLWDEGVVLDQGSEGACVGFAWTNELLAEPEQPKKQPSAKYANSVARSVYYEAKTLDQWPGEDYDGTSVLAGAQVMKRMGFIGEYRWCFDIKDVRDAVIAEGPVVLGIPWYSGMYDTDANGIVRIKGEVSGGHAITVTGFHPNLKIGNTAEPYFRWRNSWGDDYGVGGSGWIRYKDLEFLLKQNGEACVPMKREVPVFQERVSLIKRLFGKK